MHADKRTGGAADDSVAETDEQIELASEVFSMLADPTRIRIVLALRDGEMSVGDIAEAVGKAPAAVSQHLAKLRLTRMVASRQDGTRVLYRLANEHASRLVRDALHQAEHAVDDDPAHHRQDAAASARVGAVGDA